MEKRRSPWIAIILAIVIGLMVIVLLNGVLQPVTVVVAKVAIAPGTLLTADLLELRTIPMQARPKDAFSRVEDLQDKVVAVGRAPGDYITASVLGNSAQAGLPANLPPDHLAVAVKVDLASGMAGLLREGQTVTLIGMLSPDVLQSIASPAGGGQFPDLTGHPDRLYRRAATPTPTPTPAPKVAPLARIAISGVKVLMVPQSFRYEELPSTSTQDQLFASARTVSAAQDGSVIVLDVPAAPVELVPGLKVNPTTLIVALSKYGSLYLTLEPAGGFQAPAILTLNLADLYDAMNDDTRRKTAMTIPDPDPKVTVMLAGPGHETVFYQMQPPFLSDSRFVISAHATQWTNFEQNLVQMRPDLVVVQVEIAPGPEALLQVLAGIQVWQGVAILVLSAAVARPAQRIRKGVRGARRLHRPGQLGRNRPIRLCGRDDRTRPSRGRCPSAAGLPFAKPRGH